MYRIDVKATDYGPLSTNALKLPLASKITAANWVYKDLQKYCTDLNTSFEDAKGKNYYAIKVERYHGDTLLQEIYANDYRFLNPSDVFNDELFENKLAKITREITIFDNKHKITRLKIRLYTLDEATYSFFKTLDNQDFAKGEFFLEPIKIYTNIKNGYGVWGAYCSSTFEIKL